MATAVLCTTALAPISATASTITGWNFGNVIPGSPVTGTDGDASVVYDRILPDAGAQSNGQIYYEAPEANAPGLKVVNTPYSTGQGSYSGCIMASSLATCDSAFQSGKRFKQQATSTGSIDLVFDVDDADGQDNLYQVFHRVVNLTGQLITDFTVELGFGTGASFVSSTAGDGLGFSLTSALGPNNVPAFSQFPFGLFGDADTQPNPNPLYTLDGFFDGTSRAGFDLAVSEDTLSSGNFYGNYGDLFGAWLSREMAPGALLWDFANGASDPLVMAWDNGSQWEVRRGISDLLGNNNGIIDVADVFGIEDPNDWMTFDYTQIASLQNALGGIPLDLGVIEDLANLNLNYAVNLGAGFSGDNFTLRVNTNGIPAVAPVPLPATASLLAGGIFLLGAARRRRKAV